jgi:hypothetical protein
MVNFLGDKMTVYDCTQFFQENDVYEIRLNQHWDFVDKFIVIEAGETHTGRPKPFRFDHERFAPYKEKLHYVKFDNFQTEIDKYPWLLDKSTVRDRPNSDKDDWIRDLFQFNWIYKTLLELNANDDDVVIFSPCDEILKKEAVDEAISYFNDPNWTHPHGLRPVVFFDTFLYIYKINLQHKIDNGEYACSSMTQFSNFKKILPGTLRELYYTIRTHPNIKNAGWHFSSIDNTNGHMLLEKYLSWAHSNDVLPNRDKTKAELQTPEEAIERTTQDFGFIFNPVPITYDTHPKWVVDNQDKLENIIYKG